MVALAVLAAVACMLRLQPAAAAGTAPAAGKCNTKDWDYELGPQNYDGNGNVTFENVELRQCNTLLKADKAVGSGVDDKKGIVTWKFTGKVHLEFDGAKPNVPEVKLVTVDAQAATVVTVDGRVHSVDMPSVQPGGKPVHVEFNNAVLDVDSATAAFADGRITTIQAQGAPAQFSHVLKKSGRAVSGRADRIDYNTDTSVISLNSNVQFFRADDEVKAQTVTYNLEDGSGSSPKSTGVYRLEERVPAPRTPDRTSAK